MITSEQHLTEHMYLNTPDGWECCDCGWREERERASGGTIFTYAAHVAATWKEARTVRTVEQLDALPTGTIMRCGYGLVWEKLTGHRRFSGMDVGKDLGVPALVLWTPEDGAL